MSLSNKELALLLDLLRDYQDELANNGCNDWNFPHNWSKEEKISFVKEFHEYNGDPEEFNEKYLHVHDYAVVGLLRHKLKKLIKE